MHTTINYNVIADVTKKEAKAIADVKNWIGHKKFVSIGRDVKRCVPAMSWNQFEIMCELGGIKGYPVSVWWESLGFVVPNPALIAA